MMKLFKVTDGIDHCIIVANSENEASQIALRDNFEIDGEPTVDELVVSEMTDFQDEDGNLRSASWWSKQCEQPGMIASTLF